MEKLILHDNTELPINDGMTENSFSVSGTAEEIGKIYAQLTESNLSDYRLVKEVTRYIPKPAPEPAEETEETEPKEPEYEEKRELVMSYFHNKRVKSYAYSEGTGTFYLENVNLTEQRLSKLENDVTDVQMAMADIYEAEI